MLELGAGSAEATTRSSARRALGVDLNGLALAAALGEEIAPERLARATPRVAGACVLLHRRRAAASLMGVERGRRVGARGGVGPRLRRLFRAGAARCSRLESRAASEALERAARAAECVRFPHGPMPQRSPKPREHAISPALRDAGRSPASAARTSIWKIDPRQTLHILAHADFAYFLGAVAIMVLLGMADGLAVAAAARSPGGIHDRLSVVRSRVLRRLHRGPGAADRGRRRRRADLRDRPGGIRSAGGAVAGSVLLERALGGAATLALAAVGFALAIGRATTSASTSGSRSAS